MTFPLELSKTRSAAEIVDQTNALARLYMCLAFNLVVAEGYQFHDSVDPRAAKSWHAACEIMQMMTATDPNDALTDLEEEEATPDPVAESIDADEPEWPLDAPATEELALTPGTDANASFHVVNGRTILTVRGIMKMLESSGIDVGLRQVISDRILEASRRNVALMQKQQAINELCDAAASVLIDVDSEIEQRQHSGNDEDFAELQAKSNRLHAALKVLS